MYSGIEFGRVEFKWSDLHKMTGQIVVMEPSEADIAEGNLLTKVWFVTLDRKMYLLHEEK